MTFYAKGVPGIEFFSEVDLGICVLQSQAVARKVEHMATLKWGKEKLAAELLEGVSRISLGSKLCCESVIVVHPFNSNPAV
jgi:hypothetical protein